MGRYFRIILLAVFLLSVLLIVVLQFNSDRSINLLIEGNESLLEELKIRNDLVMLQGSISALESKVRGTIISAGRADSNDIQKEFNAIEEYMQRLSVLENREQFVPLLTVLYRQVNAKTSFNRNVLGVYDEKGKAEAEAMINTGTGSRLTDSIRITTASIHQAHTEMVTALIESADKNGIRAKTFGTFMALVASLTAILAFGFAIYKMQQQQQLIVKLHDSERAAREAAHLKERFLANMSHEIRTPMNAILGFTDLLLHEPLHGRAREFVSTIRRSSENLLNVINDILDLSRMEAGMLKIDSVPFRVDEVILGVEQMFSTKAAEKGIQFTVNLDPDVPPVLTGDPTRLAQILVNLVGNAIKFTDNGYVSLVISAVRGPGHSCQLMVKVEDTGIGISPDKLNAVFERFRQADDEVNRRYGGTGLGLAIVSDLVKMLHGHLSVESMLGKGTAFNLVIPFPISDEEIKLEPISERPSFYSPLRLHVLVVEDNSINQNLVRHLLSQWGITYEITDRGEEAIQKLKDGDFDLVLMDIQMPGMDGYETTVAIRRELGLSIPVIAMTAHALAQEKERCLASGMDGYISKPLRQGVFYQLLKTYAKAGTPEFKTIDLRYMREVSGGDVVYEKLVTSQFLEAIPEALDQIAESRLTGQSGRVRQLAHNLRTTLAIMGLDDRLRPLLDTLEFREPTDDEFGELYHRLHETCQDALREAGQLLDSFPA